MSILRNTFKRSRKEPIVKGLEVDFNNCWTLNKINNRHIFLSRIIELVPIDSIWYIEGIVDEIILSVISKYFDNDNTKMEIGTIWPKQKSYRIKLTKEAKAKILNVIDRWALDWQLEHQHIYKDNEVFLSSYDNLHKRATWVSKGIEWKEMEKLKTENIIDYYETNNSKTAPNSKS